MYGSDENGIKWGGAPPTLIVKHARQSFSLYSFQFRGGLRRPSSFPKFSPRSTQTQKHGFGPPSWLSGANCGTRRSRYPRRKAPEITTLPSVADRS